jgi:hypothetical protein
VLCNLLLAPTIELPPLHPVVGGDLVLPASQWKRHSSGKLLHIVLTTFLVVSSQVLGVIGALDPHAHKRNQVLLQAGHPEGGRAIVSPEGPTARSALVEDLPVELLPSTGMSTSSDDYYPTVAINALMRILREKSMSSYHQRVVGSLMYIFKAMGLTCVPYLPKVSAREALSCTRLGVLLPERDDSCNCRSYASQCRSSCLVWRIRLVHNSLVHSCVPPSCLSEGPSTVLYRSLLTGFFPWQVLPDLFHVMTVCDDALRDFLLRQLAQLVAIVRQVRRHHLSVICLSTLFWT